MFGVFKWTVIATYQEHRNEYAVRGFTASQDRWEEASYYQLDYDSVSGALTRAASHDLPTIKRVFRADGREMNRTTHSPAETFRGRAARAPVVDDLARHSPSSSLSATEFMQ